MPRPSPSPKRPRPAEEHPGAPAPGAGDPGSKLARANLAIARDGFPALLAALKKRGFQLLGPTVRDGAIACSEIDGADDLPAGWSDEQGPGSYRLKKRKDAAIFRNVVGPQSWKRWFLPPDHLLWTARREGRGFRVDESDSDPRKFPPIAILGARSCELHALRIQDRVFREGPHIDPYYAARRSRTFIVAVNCTEPAATCFCSSLETGPAATEGYDLVLTEVLSSGRHWFAVGAGSEAGADVLREVPHAPISDDQMEAAEASIRAASSRMKRRLQTDGLKDLLYSRQEHPHWEDVAKRCLACANCTMVCPTCFCTTVEDWTDLAGDRAERRRKWDSCFTKDFSYIYGGQIRRSTESRYRQWLTHKLAYWQDQFGTLGCVGCGRCIAWCPAGIDITEEVRSIRSGGHETRRG